MSSAADGIEDLVTISIGLLILGAVAYLIWHFRGFFGIGQSSTGDVQQSLDNTLSGFPDGADPGQVPAAQYAQGVAESVRNFGDYVFGSDGSQIADYTDPVTYLSPDTSGMSSDELSPFSAQNRQGPTVNGNAVIDWLFGNRVF